MYHCVIPWNIPRTPRSNIIILMIHISYLLLCYELPRASCFFLYYNFLSSFLFIYLICLRPSYTLKTYVCIYKICQTVFPDFIRAVKIKKMNCCFKTAKIIIEKNLVVFCFGFFLSIIIPKLWFIFKEKKIIRG